MFQKGERVVYGMSGVCTVEDITALGGSGKGEERLYYVLIPLNTKGSHIYTPVDNQKAKIRRILTAEEANALIDSIPEREALRISSEKLREAEYKAAIRSGRCEAWVGMIKTLHARRQERTREGKKITATDERYLKAAEDYLFGELAAALKIAKEDMRGYIVKRIRERTRQETPEAVN